MTSTASAMSAASPLARQMCALNCPAPNAACARTESCEAGTTCQAGRCLPECGLSCPGGSVCYNDTCRPSCQTSSDCRPSFGCVNVGATSPICAPQGNVNAGQQCQNNADCVSLLCLDGRCAGDCDNCPDNRTCITTPMGSWCVAIGESPVGAPCSTGPECLSGLCLSGRCGGPCPAEGCPTSTRCAQFGGLPFCEGFCRVGRGDCSIDEICSSEDGDSYWCRPQANSSVGTPCSGDGECSGDAPILRHGCGWTALPTHLYRL